MNTFIKGIIVILVLLLSGCYVQPWGYRHGYYDNSYNRSYSNGYYNSGYYNNGYRSVYQNTYPNRSWEGHEHHEGGERHYDNDGYSNRSGRNWQGGQQFGHHGRH